MNRSSCEVEGGHPASGDVKQLEAHLQSHLGRRIKELQLSLRENGLILRGRCRTYYAKQLAQHAVMSATLCPIVANEIEVW
jgi:hypothetical protein